jgi:hypothetical protein
MQNCVEYGLPLLILYDPQLYWPSTIAKIPIKNNIAQTEKTEHKLVFVGGIRSLKPTGR